MAETLGFYELLHSAGGHVREVMCSARLDLNNLDIEKGWNKLTRGEQREAHRLRFSLNYRIITYIIDRCINKARVHNI